MPQPKKRHSNSRQGKRRASSFTLSCPKTTNCPDCGAAMLPHHACSACGSFRGKKVIKLKTKKEKK